MHPTQLSFVRRATHPSQWGRVLAVLLALFQVPLSAASKSDRPDAARYRDAVVRFADRVLESGRDRYGSAHSPLFVDGLHAATLEPAIWKGPGGVDWVLSNFASQQSMMRSSTPACCYRCSTETTRR